MPDNVVTPQEALAAALARTEVVGLVHGFDPHAFLASPDNRMLDEGGDIALLTHLGDGVWEIHWLLVSRGASALTVGRRFIAQMFGEGATAICGLTPVGNRKARWFARRLGGVSYGIGQHPLGACEKFILTAARWRALNAKPPQSARMV